jgi:hypothetical protein
MDAAELALKAESEIHSMFGVQCSAFDVPFYF